MSKYLDNNNNNNNNIVQGFINICFSHVLTITLKIMKKLLSTLALVLAISSVSMAKSSSKKNVSNSSNSKSITHKKMAVRPVIMCDAITCEVVGVIFSNGETEGNVGVGTCVC